MPVKPWLACAWVVSAAAPVHADDVLRRQAFRPVHRDDGDGGKDQRLVRHHSSSISSMKAIFDT